MGRVRNANLLGGAIVFVVLLGSLTASGKVIYVDADAPGPLHTGSIWTYAYKHIQDALTEANFSVKPVEIHVAQGIYRPDETSTYPGGTGDRFATFQLINGVILKGGYAGNGQPDPDMRDFTIYETILSGDLNGDDGPDFTNNGENSYNVITASVTDATAVLDGFTITAGNANGYDVDSLGGGMFNYNSNPTLTNCTFSGNWATESGGGMENINSSPTLTNCTFSDNSTPWAGGGIANDGDSSPMLANCTFSGNSAEVGGGMCSYYCSPILTNCTFSGNSANLEGGGMTNWDNSNPALTNCTFSGNSAGDGGGMNNGDSSSPTLSNCTFSKNSAETGGGGGMNNWGESSPVLTDCTFNKNLSGTGGGGMCNVWGSSPMLSNCTFSDNSAGWGGGGIDNYENCNPTLTNCKFSGNSATWDGGGLCNSTNSHPTITNCTFINNTAEYYSGGGINNLSGSNPTLTNCIFTGNLAGDAGGGMSNKENSNPALTNCILWGNTASSGAQIHKDDTCFVTITYTDIQGGWLGTGNIDTDPCFADAFNGDFHLKSEAGRWNPDSESWIIDSVTSPCIDSGDFASGWKTELWPHGCRINMGAYGGTPEASMSLLDPGSIADIDVDGQIDGRDMKLITEKWLFEEVLLPEDLNRDGIVNFTDYAIFAYIRGLPSPASNPYPTDGAISVSTTADLSWTSGPGVTSHDVYFGTSNPPSFIGNQSTTTYDPGTMADNTSYYWRIDEIGDAGKINGLVWSFTTMMSPP